MDYEQDVVPWVKEFAARFATRFPRADIDECEQLGMITAWERLKTWEPDTGSWKDYLYFPVYHAFLKEGRRHNPDIDSNFDVDRMPTADRELARIDDWDTLGTLAQDLPADQRRIIRSVSAGHNLRVVAEQLKDKYENVRRKYHQAVAAMARRHRRGFR
jgi:RNA polymerase sigma factor (sigma-70 family)